MDCSPPGSSVHRIFQAWILEWVAISFSRGSSQSRDQTWVSCTAGIFFLPTELPGKPKCEHLRDTKSSIKRHFPNSQLSCYKSIYGTRSIQSVRPVGFNQTDYEKFTDMVFDFILQLVFFKKTIACQVLESTKEEYTILTKKDYWSTLLFQLVSVWALT